MVNKMIGNFENDIVNCLSVLQSGGIILYPTDTIWGIGCDATNSISVQRIFQLKKREEKKSMIILVNDENMISDYVSNPSVKILSYISSAKKPTTAIFKNAIHLPNNLINEDGSIAIRIVQDDFCRELINQLKKPVVSTSANISGEKFPQNFTEISKEIKNGVDCIVQHRQNDFSKSVPSSIIKLNENDEIDFIR
ncbi:MAG TPA: L-threonylcarbamoyladenylate synthase [Hanamia sp.]|nr:L-threonylcarbamoyladenylate synthase [Hanamia sp.]